MLLTRKSFLLSEFCKIEYLTQWVVWEQYRRDKNCSYHMIEYCGEHFIWILWVVSKKIDLNLIVRYCTQAKVVYMDRNDVRSTVHVSCFKKWIRDYRQNGFRLVLIKRYNKHTRMSYQNIRNEIFYKMISVLFQKAIEWKSFLVANVFNVIFIS